MGFHPQLSDCQIGQHTPHQGLVLRLLGRHQRPGEVGLSFHHTTTLEVEVTQLAQDPGLLPAAPLLASRGDGRVQQLLRALVVAELDELDRQFLAQFGLHGGVHQPAGQLVQPFQIGPVLFLVAQLLLDTAQHPQRLGLGVDGVHVRGIVQCHRSMAPRLFHVRGADAQRSHTAIDAGEPPPDGHLVRLGARPAQQQHRLLEAP